MSSGRVLCGEHFTRPFSGRRDRLAALPENALEHDPEKWVPVFGKDHAQTTRSWRRDDDSKGSHHALATRGSTVRNSVGPHV
jgi:hypothetical protein